MASGYMYDIGADPDMAVDVSNRLGCPIEPGGLASPIMLEGGVLVGGPGWEWDDHWELITAVSEPMEINPVHYNRPENLSRALYGTAELWPILMRLNGCETRADFVGPYLRVVRRESLYVALDVLTRARERAKKRTVPVYRDMTIRQIRY